jgi:ABC-type phosphate transport system substrate-binding protein
MKKLLFLCLAAIAILAGTNAFAQVAIIANKSVGAASIDAGSAANIYALDLKNFGGATLVLFDLADGNDAKSKFYGFLGKSPADMKKVWLKAKLTGNGNPPTTVGSDDEMLKKVASTPGAIGYISASKVNGDVKVLKKID